MGTDQTGHWGRSAWQGYVEADGSIVRAVIGRIYNPHIGFYHAKVHSMTYKCVGG